MQTFGQMKAHASNKLMCNVTFGGCRRNDRPADEVCVEIANEIAAIIDAIESKPDPAAAVGAEIHRVYNWLHALNRPEASIIIDAMNRASVRWA